jgi:hypothetical protein
MAYLINRYNGEQLTVLDDGTLDTTTSLTLLGRNYAGYGEIQNENSIFLLENFANDTSPSRPISGQLWYNSSNGRLYQYDGDNWRTAAIVEVSSVAPNTKTEGSLWVDTDSEQLSIYVNDGWQLIGPQGLEGYETTNISAAELKDISSLPYPCLEIALDGAVIGIISRADFRLGIENPRDGFSEIKKGITLKSDYAFVGNLNGVADSAERFTTARLINGTPFDGTSDITISSSTTNALVAGMFINGSNFDGSSTTVWNIDATSSNTIGKIVSRDSQGNFSASTITSNLIGNVQGNITATSGTSSFNRVEASEFIGATLSGNAFSATRLETPRNINGVSFSGLTDITVPAAAGSLTGSILAPGIIESSLTTLGTLNSLEVAATGINVGGHLTLKSFDSLAYDEIESTSSNGLVLSAKGTGDPNLDKINLVSANRAEDLGMEAKTTLIPKVSGAANLGGNAYRYNKLFANRIDATNLDTQTLASTAGDNNITISSNLIVSGNLVVNGNTTTINSTEVAIDDLLFTVAKNATSPTEANGAGLNVNGAFAQIFYSTTGDKWVINKKLDAQNNDIITTGLFQGTATSARYADLAENYQADDSYDVGTVLDFGGQYEVTLSQEDSTRIAGVVSANPAYLMNSGLTGSDVIPLALQGRVMVKIKGPATKGDFLVSAGDGYARAEPNPKLGSIIGKSLENSDGGKEMIEMVVGRI